MNKSVVLKVTAYITRKNNGVNQLLVFEEQGFEHLGLQVPGGTVEPNESFEDAVLREVMEESGLSGLTLVRKLGKSSYYSDSLGVNIERYYFHLHIEQLCDDQFTYTVKSNDEDNGWVYKYDWINIGNALPKLYGELGNHLVKIWRSADLLAKL